MSEVAPHALDVGLKNPPHVIRGQLVRNIEVTLERLVHHTRAGADTAVVQVDDGAVECEAFLDHTPEVFVAGHVSQASPALGFSSFKQAVERFGVVGGEGGASSGTGAVQELPSGPHR